MRQQETAEERAELDLLSGDPIYQDAIQKALLDAFYMDKPLSDLADGKQEQILTAIRQLNLTVMAPPRSRQFWLWTAIAASLLLFLTPYLLKKENTNSIVVKTTRDKVDWSSADTVRPEHSIVNSPRPAKEKATLTLADGFEMDLESLKDGQTVSRAGLKIEKLETGNLAIVFENNARDQDDTKVNSIHTPKGGWYWIILGDGTKVQLNASSTLKFPSRFTGNKREVFLEGEGYFEVSKDKLRQFVVTSGTGSKQQQVTVYGTVFNVMAYPEKPHMITTLLEGSVKVKDYTHAKELMLTPHQQAVVSSNGLQVGKADLIANLAWRNKLFYFANTPLDEVMLEISRWYNVDIRYKTTFSQLRVWGQITREKSLFEVLDILAETNDIRFDVKGREVVVSMK